MTYSRFAIYYLPPDGPLADFGAAWLGWDVARGCPVDQPHLTGLDDITMTPRKYGLHGTLKPPFRLAEGCDVTMVEKAAVALAKASAPAQCDGLALSRIGQFLALTPTGDTSGLQRVASACVTELDHLRAPAGAVELARRRKAGLSERQEALLMQWGYPYVMEEFRFHLTLSGALPPEDIVQWSDHLAAHLPELPAPFMIDEVALCGERSDGNFELIHRYTLSG